MSSPAATLRTASAESLDLDAELELAVEEIDRGDCIELSTEQLERCALGGEWPWPDESLG